MLRWTLIALVSLAAIVIVGLAGAIAFGTKAAPPPMPSMDAGVTTIRQELADLPPALRFTARDGTSLAYRAYPASPDRIAVMIHGSSGSSAAVHVRQGVAGGGISVFAPDIRGHGESGRIGDIDYIGQLDDDLADLLAALGPAPAGGKRILIGHSSGGGFTLRIAGGAIGDRFDGYFARRISAMRRRQCDRTAMQATRVPRIIALAVLRGSDPLVRRIARRRLRGSAPDQTNPTQPIRSGCGPISRRVDWQEDPEHCRRRWFSSARKRIISYRPVRAHL
jgi:pimeloyl-ACP methyl ester carboxylesterase